MRRDDCIRVRLRFSIHYDTVQTGHSANWADCYLSSIVCAASFGVYNGIHVRNDGEGIQLLRNTLPKKAGISHTCVRPMPPNF